MRPVQFTAWDDSTRYALTVGPNGQVVSSTTNKFRAAVFWEETVTLEAQYRHDKEERRKREQIAVTTKV